MRRAQLCGIIRAAICKNQYSFQGLEKSGGRLDFGGVDDGLRVLGEKGLEIFQRDAFMQTSKCPPTRKHKVDKRRLAD